MYINDFIFGIPLGYRLLRAPVSSVEVAVKNEYTLEQCVELKEEKEMHLRTSLLHYFDKNGVDLPISDEARLDINSPISMEYFPKGMKHGAILGAVFSGVYTALKWFVFSEKAKREKLTSMLKSVFSLRQKKELEELKQEHSSVKYLEHDGELSELLASEKIVIVDFYGIPCPPCQALAPVYKEIADKYWHKVAFASLNAYESGVAGKEYAIRGVPTVIVFEDGKEKERMVGFKGRDQLEDLISRSLEK